MHNLKGSKLATESNGAKQLENTALWFSAPAASEHAQLNTGDFVVQDGIANHTSF
jgi:hypothetical protein